MAPNQYPSTCLSDRPHDHQVSDVRLHFSGCLRISKRPRFYESLPEDDRARIRRDSEKIAELRHRLETTQCDSTAASHLRSFKQAMGQWCIAAGRPHASHESFQSPDSRRLAYISSPDLVNRHVKAPVFYFRDGKPIDVPGLPNHFPNQKVVIADLLADDPSRNPLMQPSDDATVRYFHLPANNMIWVEEAIARYYHERRADHDDLNPKYTRRRRTRTETLLRPEFWHGQQNYDVDSEVHARHMRPLCDGITVDGDTAKNLVLFMPYLHWESDRGRVKSDEMVKEAHNHNVPSISEVVNQAREHKRLSRVQTQDTSTPVLAAPQGWGDFGGDQPQDGSERRRALGRVLRTAAALMEAMDSHNEEMLVLRYLHAQPPLHPRRTLDQSYYGALKSTRARDRDQVVYRGTMAEGHDCIGMDACAQCNEDIRKVPRIIMVDQLWLWILDKKTVISAFPRRWGRNRPDPSAIHKTLRQRLDSVRPGEINSAYDLALMIVDECSRVFFDRARPSTKKPNLVELFAGAIRDLTYKQTAAFDQFLIYTHLAGRDYKHAAGERLGGGGSSVDSTQNTLLNINPEGNLLKEVKDIVDEILIMVRIKEQQQAVMEGLVKNVRRAMVPLARRKRGSPKSEGWVVSEDEDSVDDPDGSGQRVNGRARQARQTLNRADNLLADLSERIAELRGLLQIAQQTSASLKDILTLKQQQAGVIEAREAVKQAQLTLKQGQSIMIFTIVTIIFLPLSFCVGLFGMNAIEFSSDAKLPLATQFSYMFPVSAGITVISFTLAFSQSVHSNSVVALVRSMASFGYNTVLTWLAVKTGMYMAGREMSRTARVLREREAKITGAMKAEVMRKEKNLEKMRAATHVRQLTMRKEAGVGGGRLAEGSTGDGSGRTTPFSPFAPGSGAGLSPFLAPAMGGKRAGAVQMAEVDVELGDRGGRRLA